MYAQYIIGFTPEEMEEEGLTALSEDRLIGYMSQWDYGEYSDLPVSLSDILAAPYARSLARQGEYILVRGFMDNYTLYRIIPDEEYRKIIYRVSGAGMTEER